MSDPLTHIVMADLIGKVTAKIPDDKVNEKLVIALAFIGGMTSHALLDRIDADYTPDWTQWKSNAEALQRDSPHIALQITGIAKQVYDLLGEKDEHTFKIRLASILGYLSTEMIDVIYSIVNPDAWQKGQLLMPWHKADVKQQQSLSDAIKRDTFINLAQWTWRW